VLVTTILVIDDEVQLLENVTMLLQLAGYQVYSTANAPHGLELAREKQPTLILCDIMMPEIDGYGVLKALQQDSRTSTIPFIFLTAKADIRDHQRGMRLGADDYLTKPFSEAELLTAIRIRLEKRSALETQQFHQFARYMVAQHELEQRRLVETLNRDVREQLVDLKFALDLGQRLPQKLLSEALPSLQSMIEQTLGSLTTLTQILYPAMLDHLGLLPTLTWYVDHVQSVRRIPTTLIAAFTQRLTPDMEMALYRIVQEAVQYGIAISTTQEIHIHLEVTESLQLRICLVGPALGQHLDTNLFIKIREYTAVVHGQCSTRIINADSVELTVFFPHVVFQIEGTQQNGEAVSPEIVPHTETYVLLALSSPIIARQITHLLRPLSYLHIVGHANSYQEVIQYLKQTSIDVLILDLPLSLSNLAFLSTQVATIFLSAHSDRVYAEEIFKQGVRGYLLKETAIHELIEAIQCVRAGQIYVTQAVSINMSPVAPPVLDLNAILTPREHEIFDHIIAGLTHADIAERLVISPRTVEKHRANLMQKIGLQSHTDLILFAVRQGLLIP
jgi:DNA-binding NarL/FixJ family response regulator